MLILAKSVLAIMLGFISALITGLILIPILRKKNIGQNTSKLINERHIKKAGTPTLGGLIFIIPTILSLFILYFKGSLTLSSNLIILVFVFLSYGLLGFIDDYKKLKYKNNKGLSIITKLVFQLLIAVVMLFTKVMEEHQYWNCLSLILRFQWVGCLECLFCFCWLEQQMQLILQMD